VLSPLLLIKSGIIYLPQLKYLHHLTPSNVTSKHTILPLRNFLTTNGLPRTSDLIFFNFGALTNLLHGIAFYSPTRKPPAACKNLGDILHKNRFIAYFVLNFAVIVTWVCRRLCVKWQQWSSRVVCAVKFVDPKTIPLNQKILLCLVYSRTYHSLIV